MDTDNKKTYRSMIKGTAVFGGVQAFNVIINIIRGKLVAIFLGTAGMGISSLYHSAMAPIKQFSNFGLDQSSVRLISMAKEGNAEYPLDVVTSVYNILIKVAALIGLMFTILFSYQLSCWTFGDSEYRYWFILIGVIIGIQILTSGKITFLQGLREYKRIAKASIVGPVAGLLFGVPLYYFFGVKGIVPAMFVLAIVSYLYAIYNTRSINIPYRRVDAKLVWTVGKDILMMGIVMMSAQLIGLLSTYGLNLCIRTLGSVSDVGLFQAANSITNQYSGLVFAAMAADFYPRLSAVSKERERVNELVNAQSEITMLVIIPIAALVMITAPVIIQILLTEEFMSTVNIVKCMGFSLIFKAIAYPIGYISFSKGDKKYFFCVEGLWINIKTFSVFTVFFYFYGIYGLGYAAIVSSIIDVIVASILNSWRYGFRYSKDMIILASKLIPVAAIIFALVLWNCNWIALIASVVLFILISIYAYRELNKRMDITEFIKKKFHKQ